MIASLELTGSGLTNSRTSMSIHPRVPYSCREIGTCAVVIHYSHGSPTPDGSVNADFLPPYRDFFSITASHYRDLKLPLFGPPPCELLSSRSLLVSATCLPLLLWSHMLPCGYRDIVSRDITLLDAIPCSSNSQTPDMPIPLGIDSLRGLTFQHLSFTLAPMAHTYAMIGKSRIAISSCMSSLSSKAPIPRSPTPWYLLPRALLLDFDSYIREFLASGNSDASKL
jgi:hypothetical protein